MELKNVFTDDRAVSPVIGVILMVAITVILAAVIGTFVLGLGDSVQQTTPSASFSFDYEENETGQYNVTVTHEGGDQIDANQVDVSFTNSSEEEQVTEPWDGADPVSAGASSTHTDVNTGSDVRVIWTADDGSSSSTIGRSSAP